MQKLTKLKSLIGKRFLYKTHEIVIKAVHDGEFFLVEAENKTITVKRDEVDKFVSELLPVSSEPFRQTIKKEPTQKDMTNIQENPDLSKTSFNGQQLVKGTTQSPQPVQHKSQEVEIMTHTVQQSADIMGKLKTTLMDNIDEPKKNKDFISQAQEINSSIKTLIELMKTEVLVVRTLKG